MRTSRFRNRLPSRVLLPLLLLPLMAELAAAAEVVSAARVSADAEEMPRLKAQIEQQHRELVEQRRMLESQSALLEELQRQITAIVQSSRSDRSESLKDSGLVGELYPRRDAGRLASNAQQDVADDTTPSQPVVLEPKAYTVVAEKPDPTTFRAYWKEGLRFDTGDKKFQVRIGGRIHNDWGFFSGSDEVESAVGPLQDGTEFRRSRLYVSGVIHDRAIFKAEYDFAGGATFKDVYIGLTKLPVVGNIRAGHFKEPFNLEEITGDNYITFMERSLPNAFAPSRKTGIMIHDAELDEKMTWAFGVFRDTDDFGDNSADGKYNLTGRVTARPWNEDGGRRLLHLGTAYSRRKSLDGLFRVRGRPETHLAPRFVDTGFFPGKTLHMVGSEAAIVLGSTSFQSELINAFVDQPGADRVQLNSFYVTGSYFLTGEHRVYRASNGTFGRVSPLRSFGAPGTGGSGAWEVAVRYSRLDLNSRFVLGGELQDITFGLNWYVNPNTRIMWNYVLADRIDVGIANLFQTRFQVDF